MRHLLFQWGIPVIVLVGIFSGLAFVGMPLLERYRFEKRSADWPTIQAEIKSASVENGVAKISYRYALDKALVTGSCLRLSLNNRLSLPTLSEQERFLNAFTPGKKIRVAVNPMRTMESVCFPGVWTDTQLGIASAFSFVIFGSVLMLLWVHVRRGNPLPNPKRSVVIGSILLFFGTVLAAVSYLYPYYEAFPAEMLK